MIAIKTADLTQDFKQYADRIVRGEIVLISRPRNENLVIITEERYNELELQARTKMQETLKKLQKSAIDSGAEGMDMDEIYAEIQVHRQEKQGI